MTDHPESIYRQSAAIPYLTDGMHLRIVLITANSSGRWIIPKGIVEHGMSAHESAAKEALEEAGVLGEISAEVVAEYDYRKWGGTCHVEVYPLRVTEVLAEWEEMDVRERRILASDEAIEQAKPAISKVLREFAASYRATS